MCYLQNGILGVKNKIFELVASKFDKICELPTHSKDDGAMKKDTPQLLVTI